MRLASTGGRHYNLHRTTDHSPQPHRCETGLSPWNPTRSNASACADRIVSVESFTGIDMPLDLHGRGFGTHSATSNATTMSWRSTVGHRCASGRVRISASVSSRSNIVTRSRDVTR
jgi:hypothetical protein